MKRPPDVELVLRAYLADTGDTAPDRVLTDVASRIARQPRRAWRLRGRPFVNIYARVAAAVAAVLVVAVVGYSFLPKVGPGPAGPTPTPVVTTAPTPTLAPTPTPAPTAYTCEEGTGCLGELTGGTHNTSNFAPSFAYTSPTGWFNQIDVPTLEGITPPDQPADMLLVWSGAVPAEKTSTCVLRAKAGAGDTAADWIKYLTRHPGLQATNVQSLTIGGKPAQSVDIRVLPSWQSPCAADQADHNVPIIKTPDGAPGDGYGVAGSAIARVYVVDVNGHAVVVTLFAYTGGDAEFAAQIRMGESVVKSFTFGAP